RVRSQCRVASIHGLDEQLAAIVVKRLVQNLGHRFSGLLDQFAQHLLRGLANGNGRRGHGWHLPPCRKSTPRQSEVRQSSHGCCARTSSPTVCRNSASPPNVMPSPRNLPVSIWCFGPRFRLAMLLELPHNSLAILATSF